MIFDHVHKGNDGIARHISTMETNHILKTILGQLNALERVVSASEQPMNNFQARLMGVKTLDAEEAAGMVEHKCRWLIPYWYELLIRIGSFTEEERDLFNKATFALQRVVGREEKVTINMNLLPANILIDDDDDIPF